MAKKALGKGLNSIFEDLGTPILSQNDGSQVHEVSLNKIIPNPKEIHRSLIFFGECCFNESISSLDNIFVLILY